MADWQPIETAPDNVWVLGYFSGNIGGEFSMAVCRHRFRGWEADDGDGLMKPSHWMPLPEPPQVQS